MSYSGFVTVAPGDITTIGDSSPQVNLGALAMVNGNIYMYVKFDNGDGNVAAIAGGVVYWYDRDDFVITSDYSYASSLLSMVAGITQSVLTDGYYGWILVSGYYATIKTNADDDIAKGDWLIGAGDNTCNSVAAGTACTYKPFGIAVAADVDASDTVAGMVDLL
jgi:hypothetical protein